MQIAGIQKTTLLDFPGHLAATVFTRGCNFACPFCHNADLVVATKEPLPGMTEDELFAFLKKRRGILEGVCITGGEPTLWKDLPSVIGKIKDMGFLVKLDTNGSSPEVLMSLCEAGLLDYVAMDIKSSPKGYKTVCGWKGAEVVQTRLWEGVQESVAYLQKGIVPYEFRTTLVKGLHTLSGMHELAQWIAPASAYYLQNYQESDRVLEKEGLTSLSEEEMHVFLDVARIYIPHAKIRGEE